MTVLLDTHCWLWWIAIKYLIGKLTLPEPPDRFVPSRLERDRLEPLPVLHSHTLRTALLPYHHRDLFDRLLITQALVEGIPILTDDPAFGAYEVQTLRP